MTDSQISCVFLVTCAYVFVYLSRKPCVFLGKVMRFRSRRVDLSAEPLVCGRVLITYLLTAATHLLQESYLGYL